MLAAFLKLAERQGRLQGDLNYVQRFGLMWLMQQEVQDEVELERFRALNYALGSNSATSGDFIRTLMEEQKDEEEVIYETDDSWVQPEGIEDIKALISGL